MIILLLIFLNQTTISNLERRIQEELLVNTDLKLVVVDTFAKMRKSKDRDYDNEYMQKQQCITNLLFNIIYQSS